MCTVPCRKPKRTRCHDRTLPHQSVRHPPVCAGRVADVLCGIVSVTREGRLEGKRLAPGERPQGDRAAGKPRQSLPAEFCEPRIYNRHAVFFYGRETDTHTLGILRVSDLAFCGDSRAVV